MQADNLALLPQTFSLTFRYTVDVWGGVVENMNLWSEDLVEAVQSAATQPSA